MESVCECLSERERERERKRGREGESEREEGSCEKTERNLRKEDVACFDATQAISQLSFDFTPNCRRQKTTIPSHASH